MADRISIALAQLNPTVGDVKGNLAKARSARREAGSVDLIVFPELFICGYPPEDLVLKPSFQEACAKAVADLAAETSDGGPAVLMPTPWVIDGRLANAVAFLDEGEVKTVRAKHDLPNYGVFDEKRVFAPGPLPGPIDVRGVRIGVPICEDIWTPDVVECLEESGAEMILVPNGSPYDHSKRDERLNHAVARVTESGLPLVYLNQIGGQDELVFDGASFVIGADCRLMAHMPSWREDVLVTEWTRARADDGREIWQCAETPPSPADSRAEGLYQAMVLGLRDYVKKNGFPGVILGLSGGIDSALSAAVAVDALGPDMVHCVMMPSPYTSQESLDDAAEAAELLGVRLDEVNIGPAMDAFSAMLTPLFNGREPDITEENIQSRARGVTLMALSNKFGPMVLSTGNKSEMSTGYATLYGDMCGGYSVLKDVYKTTVFELSRWRNQSRPAGALGPAGRVMPERIITKPPSAELRPDQKDEDSLPPYEVLDDVLRCLIEGEMSVREIVERGHAPETVDRIWRLLDRAEYKRRQAPPGVKLTRRAFGKERRYPITNAYRGA